MKFQRVTPFLTTRDIARTIEFYTQLLGFRVETLHPDEPPTPAILDRDLEPSGGGGVSIIFEASLWSDPPNLTGQLHFDLSPGGVMEMYDRVKHRADMLRGPEVYPYGRREFSCRDPNGYALVFSEKTSDPPTCTD